MFAEDFENYTQGQNLGSGSTGANPTSGWGFYDSDTGGQRTVNNTNYFSCCKALWMLSPSIVSGKFDVHKMFAAANTTTQVTVSLWFSFTNGFKTNDNLMTFTLEMFDGVLKYECGIFIHPTFLFFNSDDGLPNITNKLSAYDDSNSVYAKGAWHHLSLTCNVRTFTYVAAVLDNFDYTVQVTGHKDKSLGDIEQAGFGPHILRFETALVNDATHTAGYWKWVDNVIITDSSATSTVAFSAANHLWQAVATMGSMMSVITMYSSVRAYQEPDPLRRRMKLMVAVVFAVGAGTLAVFAIILSRL